MDHQNAYEALIYEICVTHGWCGGLVDGRLTHVDDLLPETGMVSADQFVSLVFQADNVDPNENWTKWQPHFERLKDEFIRFMGSEAVDASLLKFADC